MRGYDEELLLAAVVHDVGKGIDVGDHVAAGVEALGELVTERTLWLLAFLMEAHEYRARTLPVKARRRLEESGHLEDLLLLSELDHAGRRGGGAAWWCRRLRRRWGLSGGLPRAIHDTGV